jgi:hydroxymethylpyrimidine pyrophosphatase-like HAD family hydrolase
MSLQRKSKIGIFADIDHTLAHPGQCNATHILAIPNSNGTEMVMTSSSHAKFLGLIADHWFIPTTARPYDQYSKSIFADTCKISITDNGGQVNVNGTSLALWKAILQDQINLLPKGYELNIVGDVVAKRLLGMDFKYSFEYDMYWEYTFDPDTFERSRVDELLTGFLPEEYTFNYYKHTLYVNPEAITKDKAVEFVHAYLDLEHLFALGDCKTDKAMLDYSHCGLVSPYGNLIGHNLLDHDHDLIVAPPLGTYTTDWMLNHVMITIAHLGLRSGQKKVTV